MISITRRYEFAAAHRIANHPKCGHVHGHTFKVEVTLGGKVQENGMLLDFADIDATYGKWINNNLDHAYLFYNGDSALREYTNQKTFPFVHGATVENIAKVLLKVAQEILPCKVLRVRVYESDRSWADATPDLEIKDDLSVGYVMEAVSTG